MTIGGLGRALGKTNPGKPDTVLGHGFQICLEERGSGLAEPSAETASDGQWRNTRIASGNSPTWLRLAVLAWTRFPFRKEWFITR